MDHVWRKICELRVEFELLKEDHTPIDVFTFFEVDLGLDAIPFASLPDFARWTANHGGRKYTAEQDQ